MEQANSSGPAGMTVGMVKLLAAIVTADVCLVIASHWNGYNWIQRSDAVLLLAFLAMIPSVATWRKKEKRLCEWAQLWPAYMLLLLATSLFAMH
jgi:hypothetical protein